MRYPIEVYPNTIIIPPHEYRHVTITFLPKALQQYVATFEAAVVGGVADPATATFVCELRGEGALPSLSFQVGAWSPAGLMQGGSHRKFLQMLPGLFSVVVSNGTGLITAPCLLRPCLLQVQTNSSPVWFTGETPADAAYAC